MSSLPQLQAIDGNFGPVQQGCVLTAEDILGNCPSSLPDALEPSQSPMAMLMQHPSQSDVQPHEHAGMAEPPRPEELEECQTDTTMIGADVSICENRWGVWRIICNQPGSGTSCTGGLCLFPAGRCSGCDIEICGPTSDLKLCIMGV